jgi:hypothetical protein
MRKYRSFGQLALVGAVATAVSVLGFYSTTGAAPQAGQLPFANSVEQRLEIATELREIKELLKEQNALLREARKAQVNVGKP